MSYTKATMPAVVEKVKKRYFTIPYLPLSSLSTKQLRVLLLVSFVNLMKNQKTFSYSRFEKVTSKNRLKQTLEDLKRADFIDIFVTRSKQGWRQILLRAKYQFNHVYVSRTVFWQDNQLLVKQLKGSVLKCLLLFTFHPRKDWSVKEVAEAVGLSLPTTYKALKELQGRHLIKIIWLKTYPKRFAVKILYDILSKNDFERVCAVILDVIEFTAPPDFYEAVGWLCRAPPHVLEEALSRMRYLDVRNKWRYFQKVVKNIMEAK